MVFYLSSKTHAMHDIAEILLKLTLKTNQSMFSKKWHGCKYERLSNITLWHRLKQRNKRNIISYLYSTFHCLLHYVVNSTISIPPFWKKKGVGLGLWCLTKNATDLPQVTYKLYSIMLYRVHLAWAGFELTTLVVMHTDCSVLNSSLMFVSFAFKRC